MQTAPGHPGYHSVTPYLVVRGVAPLMEFLKATFDATELHRSSRPDGSVMHAEVRIGDSIVMMGEPTAGGEETPASLYVYVEDTDGAYRRALLAGATSIREPADQPYGDRNAGVKGPSGTTWWIGTPLGKTTR